MSNLSKKHIQKVRQALPGILSEFGRTQKISAQPLFKYLKSYSLRPSKCLRSLLLLLSYHGYTGQQSSRAIYRWAASLEIIQNFALIHDDLVDQATLRRGDLVLQGGLAKLFGDNNVLGNNLALLSGDIFFALGLRQFMQISAPLERKERAMELLLNSALTTGLGEINELVGKSLAKITEKEIYQICDQKTSYYSFVTPLVVGAILAGERSEIKKLQALGLALGRAFQLRDDLSDIISDAETIGKNVLSDIKNSKLTLLAFYAYQKSNPAVRQKLLNVFQKKQKDSQDLNFVKDLYYQTGALKIVQSKINVYINKSLRLIQSLKLRAAEKNEILYLAKALNGSLTK